MRVIVSDTSCLIDLRKVRLLRALFRLPYTFVMPDLLFESELLSVSDREKRQLQAYGLQVRGLDGSGVRQAQTYAARHRKLTLPDCFALTLAERTDGAILLTGDGELRRVGATVADLEVRGVLWAVDQLEERSLVSAYRLHDALIRWRDDELVFLPDAELRARLQRLARKSRSERKS